MSEQYPLADPSPHEIISNDELIRELEASSRYSLGEHHVTDAGRELDVAAEVMGAMHGARLSDPDEVYNIEEDGGFDGPERISEAVDTLILMYTQALRGGNPLEIRLETQYLKGILRKTVEANTPTVDALIDQLRSDHLRDESYDTLSRLLIIEQLPDSVLARLLDQSDDTGGAMRRLIEQSIGDDSLYSFDEKGLCLRLVERVMSYRKKHPGAPGAVELDNIKADIYSSFQGDEKSMAIARIPESPRQDIPMSEAREFNDGVCEAAMEVMTKMDLPAGIIEQQLLAIKTRLRRDQNDVNEDGRVINGGAVRRELKKIKFIKQMIGGDYLKQIHEQFGVEVLEAYGVDQVWLLVDLAQKDPATIEHLRGGDVTVVFANARGDHNGAIVNSAKKFIKTSGRTILFEVKEAGDIYRRMAYLQQLGIKPSTLVYDSHGHPGMTTFGESGGGFRAGDRAGFIDPDGNSDKISIKQTQFGRLVRNYMQPNRGIDSTTENIGKKQIILATCSGDDRNTWRSLGVSESVAEAVAVTLGISPDTDVYASGEEMYIDQHEPGAVSFRQYDPVLTPRGMSPVAMRKLRLVKSRNFPDGEIERAVVGSVSIDKKDKKGTV